MRLLATPDDNTTDLIEALDEATRQSGNASPVSNDSKSSSASEETEFVPTRRNTMASNVPAPDTGGKSKEEPQAPLLSQEQLMQVIRELSPRSQKPKAKEPGTFSGTRDQLRPFLALITIFFESLGWREECDDDKIAYITGCLREDALKWYIPYAENKQETLWTNYEEFIEELKRQFGTSDEQGEARRMLRTLR